MTIHYISIHIYLPHFVLRSRERWLIKHWYQDLCIVNLKSVTQVLLFCSCFYVTFNFGIFLYLEYPVSDSSDVSQQHFFIFYFFCVQGLATIPVSAFYSPEHSKEFNKYIRFCFVKVNSLKWIRCQFSPVSLCCSLGGPSHSYSPTLSRRRTPPWTQQRTSWGSGVTDSKTGHDPSRFHQAVETGPGCLLS